MRRLFLSPVFVFPAVLAFVVMLLAAGAVDFLPVPGNLSEAWEKIGRALTL